MNRLLFSISIMCLICAITTNSTAAPFDPLFRIRNVKGEVMVKPGGKGDFEAVVNNKAYVYGTVLKTGRRSTAEIVFSQDNVCRVQPDALLTVLQDKADEKLKVVELEAGTIEVELEEEFHKTNNDKFQVETASAICGAIGCRFEISATTVKEQDIVIIMCHEGEVTVFGPHFNIPILTRNNWVSFSTSKDKKYTRIKNNGKTNYDITYNDSNKNQKTHNMATESVVKIWRRQAESGKAVVVTILVLNRDGTLDEAHSYTEDLSMTAKFPVDSKEPVTVPREVTEQPDEEPIKDLDDGDYEDLPEIIINTTVTTTTTLSPTDENALLGIPAVIAPSPTPVGKR